MGNREKLFEVLTPDWQLSPYTGMIRKHWIDAAKYLLEGAFRYVKTSDYQMIFPKQAGKSYPHHVSQTRIEGLEGFCRTLFIAVPLLKENPDLEIQGIKVAEYYRRRLCDLIDPTSPGYISPRTSLEGAGQILVEFGGLAVSLFAIPEILWDPLTGEQRKRIANTMLSYGNGPTIPSNWRFFNIFIMSFFKSRGYAIDDDLLREYLQESLAQYRGNGWYNDNPAYDYYSMWAFQLYGMLWSEYFGKEFYPGLSRQFHQNFIPLKDNYPYMFGRDGQMIMWGRSICYRTAAVAPFPMFGFTDREEVNSGWMRRITSGVILQFFRHPEFLKEGVPTLGFYGAYEPAVQGYSCRGSAYWLGKVFLGLLVPSNSSFWTAKENEGAWENDIIKGGVSNTFCEDSGILITNYSGIGASEVRAWCYERVRDDWQQFRSSENYNRLSYSSTFSWQADGDMGEVAMNYVVRNKRGKWEALRLYRFAGFRSDIYYRDVVLETNENIKLKLADIPLPNGILRVDKILSTEAADLRLGHYALPEIANSIKVKSVEKDGYEAQIIDNGQYQLAMVPLNGWHSMEVVSRSGLHPQSENSKVINVFDSYRPNEGDSKIYITLMLWKMTGESWTTDELLPVRKINILKDGNVIEVTFYNGVRRFVDFE